MELCYRVFSSVLFPREGGRWERANRGRKWGDWDLFGMGVIAFERRNRFVNLTREYSIRNDGETR